MSRAYICSVSTKYPENYRIGVIAGKWGVEERYRNRLAGVRPGDLLVFVVGGEFRSMHRVISNPYVERIPLWPAKNGDIFAHRVDIGTAEYEGRVSAKELAPFISFMRDKKAWGGTLQGPNGVLNGRLSSDDLALLKDAMVATSALDQESTHSKESPLIDLPYMGWAPGLLEQLTRLSDLKSATGFADPFVGAEEWRAGLQAGVYEDLRRIPTVAVLPIDRSPTETVLSTLYGLSALKQSPANPKNVRGVIYIREESSAYGSLLSGVGNLEAVAFDVRVSLR